MGEGRGCTEEDGVRRMKEVILAADARERLHSVCAAEKTRTDLKPAVDSSFKFFHSECLQLLRMPSLVLGLSSSAVLNRFVLEFPCARPVLSSSYRRACEPSSVRLEVGML
eukprot:768005-Hanusia_phi.AAC.7